MTHPRLSPRSAPFLPPETRRELSAGTPLPPGTLLLAYTDGLVERRGEDIDTGLAGLTHAPVAAGNSLADVLNTVLDRLAPANSEDDVTLLAARTLREPLGPR
jgi:serine phosphatase RsbU (regulator of sigma subunit)